MRMAESLCGSSPSDFIRLKVSRQEMPASTRMRVFALATTAQLPRLPLANTETETPIPGSIPFSVVEAKVTFRLSLFRNIRLYGRFVLFRKHQQINSHPCERSRISSHRAGQEAGKR